MSDFAKQAQEAAEQYLAAIQKIQDASLDAIVRVTSSIPDVAKDVPNSKGLPTIDEVSAAYFDFTEKLVATEKRTLHLLAEQRVGALQQQVSQTLTKPSAGTTVPSIRPGRGAGHDTIDAEHSGLLAALRAVIEVLPQDEIADFIQAVAGAGTDDDLDPTLWDSPVSTTEAIQAHMANLKAKYLRRRVVLAHSFTRTEAAQLLGISDQAVSDRLVAGDLVGLKDGRVWKLPTWQFDADTENGWLPGIADLRQHFPAGPVTLTAWVTAPNVDLDGRTPAARLAVGDVDQVLLAAQASGPTAW